MKVGGSKISWLAMACVLAARSVALGAGSVGQAVILSGDRLGLDQLGTGSWPAQGPAQADYTGAITAGQAGAFLATGNAAYQTSAFSGANYILGSAGGNYLGDETWGLALSSQISPNPNANVYRSALETYFNTGVPNYPGGTAGFANGLVNTYTSQFNEQSQALYYLAQYTAAAAYINSPYLPAWRSALISTLAQVDDNDYFPVLASSAALWGLAKAGPLDGTVISDSGFWSGVTLAQLPGIIAGRQITSGIDTGAFYEALTTNTGGYTEDAINSLLGLTAATTSGAYISAVLSTKNWLANGVASSGANQGLIADNPNSPSTTLDVYTGESLQALTTRFGVIWNGAAGNWSDSTQWSCTPYVPNNDTATGAMYDPTVNAGVVTLDVNAAVSMLTLNAGTLTGAGNLTVAGGTVTGAINMTGTFTIAGGTLQVGNGGAAAPFHTGTLVNNGSLLLNHSGGLSIGGTVTGSGSLQKMGTGTTTFSNYQGTGAVNLSAGTLAFDTTAGIRQTPAVLLQMSALSMNSGTTLDLTNHDLLIHGGNAATVEALIGSSYFFGLWNKPGITSSSAQTNPITTLGIMSGADYNTYSTTPGVFDGAPVANTDIVVKYTYSGDINLDGLVNDDDFGLFSGAYFFTGVGNYALGDLNFDGLVNDDDFGVFSGNYFFTPPTPLGGDVARGGSVPVPEPASLILLGLGCASIILRKRRMPLNAA